MPRFIRRRTLPDPEAKGQKQSLAQVLEKYLGERTNLTESTRRHWRSAIKRFAVMLPQPISELTEKHFAAYQGERRRAGIKGSTIQSEMFLACIALRRAGSNLNPSIPNRDETVVMIVSKDQQSALLAAAPTLEVKLMIRLGLEGLRIGEVSSLRRRDWNPATKLLHVTESKTKAGIRRIPVSKETGDLIGQRLEEMPASQHWPLFHYQGQQSPNRLHRLWERTRDACGVAARFHDLRHTAITEMCEAGVPDWTIRAIVGHVDEQMIKLYSHPRIEAMQEARNKRTAAQQTREAGERFLRDVGEEVE